MKKITLLLFAILSSWQINAQAGAYSFTQSTEAYTPVVGTSSTATGDDGIQDMVPIGFTFNFDGVNYTNFGISTNGWIKMGTVAIGGSSWTNTLDNAAVHRPLIAPFWDDHNLSSGNIQYSLTGTAPNQILEVGWDNISISNGGTASTTVFGSFKLRLYQTTNVIEFVYGPSITSAGTISASVGLNGGSSFLSVTPDVTATASSVTANNNISETTNLVGKKYTFTPPSCLSPSGLATTSLTTTSATVSWTAVGGAAQGYEYSFSTTNTPPSGAGISNAGTSVTISPLTPNSNYYFWVRSKCSATTFSSWSTFTFFTGYCLPSGTNPATYINNFSTTGGLTNITNNASGYTTGGYQDNFATSSVTSFANGSINYSFSIIAGNDAGVAIWVDWNNNLVFETTERVYTSNAYIVDGTYTGIISVPPLQAMGSYRLRIRTDWNAINPDPCAVSFNRTEAEDYKFIIVTAPTDIPDYVSLQWPPTSTINFGGNVTVYGQVYEGGLTDIVPNIVGQAPGIQAWVGISTTNTNPNTWTNWTVATWNSGHVSNNDEYQATIGATLNPGTYYYATRFQLNGGVFVYGGINASAPNNGNSWDGATFGSGVLTVNPIANDNCTGAIALTPGGVFATNAITGTTLGATTSTVAIPLCTTFAVPGNSDVWYSVVIPASGTVTVETQASTDNPVGDTVLVAYSGACGALAPIICNDDNATSAYSTITVTGLAGSLVYLGVWKYGTTAPSATTNGFRISAYDASLGNNSFDNNSFTYYPNPVKNTLNLSYNQEISNVEIFNLLGQKVNSNAINTNQAQVDMSNLSNGVYLVKVISNNQSKTIRVIKE